MYRIEALRNKAEPGKQEKNKRKKKCSEGAEMRMGIGIKKKKRLAAALAVLMSGVLAVNTGVPVFAQDTEVLLAEQEAGTAGVFSSQPKPETAQPERMSVKAEPAEPEAEATEPKGEGAAQEVQFEAAGPEGEEATQEMQPEATEPEGEGTAQEVQSAATEPEGEGAAQEVQGDAMEPEGEEAAQEVQPETAGAEEPGSTEPGEADQEEFTDTGDTQEPEGMEPPETIAPEATGTRQIMRWQWVDPEELLVYEEESEEHPARWALYLPGASEENPAFFEDVKELLPGAVLAELTAEETAGTDASAVWSDGEDTFESIDAGAADGQGSTAGQTQLALTDWKCAEYPEEGAWAGTYLFEAQLPEGYALGADAEALAVTVVPGGAEMLGFEPGDLFGATLSVNGGEEQPMSFSTALDRAVKETAPTTITLYTQADIPAMLNITNGNNITITAKEGKNASISISEKQGDRPLINVLGGTITLKNIPVVSYAKLPLFQLGGYQGYDGNPTVNIINTDISAVQTVFNCVKGNLNITGSTISSSASDVHTVQVTGGTATVTNSTLKSTGSSANTVQVTGGTANISGGSVEATGGSSCAVYLKNASLGVSGNAQLRASGSAGAVQVAGGKADINGSAKIECSGSGMGALTVTGGEVTLRDSASVSAANDYAVQLTGGSLSVSGNAGVTNTSQNSGGNKTHAVYITGGTATITGGKISAQDISHSCAVYISGSGSAEITGGSLDGKHDGVEMRGDKLRIGGNASITSSNNVALKVYSGTGAISIEGGTLKGKFLGVDLHNDSSSWKRTVTIQGGTISATTDGGGVGLYMSSSNGVVLKGGTYSYTRSRASIESTQGTLGAVLADGYAYFQGDTPIEGKLSAKTLFENPVTVKPCTHLQAGNWKADGSGVKGVCLACGKTVSAVAAVAAGGTRSYYMRIEDAWAEAKKSSQAEVILLADAEVTDRLTVENGNNIKVTGNHRLWIQTNNRSIIDVNGGSLEIGEGTIEAKNASGIYQGSGSLKVSGGTVKGVHGIDIHGTGALTVTGGSIIGARRGVVMNGSCTVTVENGTITGGTDEALDGYSSGCFLDGRGTGSMTLTVRGGTISGLYGIRGETSNDGEPGSVTVSGGTVKGTKASLLPLNSCRMQLTGGTFQQTGSGSSPNIDLQNSSANGKLRDVLADGYAFYAGNTPISGVLDQNSLSQTPVTVKKCTPHGWNWAQGTDGAWHRTCPYCGASETVRVSVTAGSETTYYQEITDAWAAAKGKTATVTLLADIEISDGLSVMAGDAITLTSDAKPDGARYILRNAGLTVDGGSLNVENANINNDAGITVNSGALAVNGGSICSSGYGISVQGGQVTLKTGIVNSKGITASKGTVLIEDSQVTSSGDDGIKVSGEAVMSITGGEITGKTYGLYVASGSVQLKDCTLTGGTKAVQMEDGKVRSLKDLLVEDYAFYQNGKKIKGWLTDVALPYRTVEVKPCGDHIWGPWTRTEGTDDYTRTCTACGRTETMANVVASVTTADGDVTFYNDFAKAWAAAREAKKATVTLLADVTYDSSDGFYFETLCVDADMEIKLVSGENAEGGACTLGGTVRKPFFQVSGSLVLEGVAIDLNYGSKPSCDAMLVTGGSLTIRSMIKAKDGMDGCIVQDNGSVTVESGGISSYARGIVVEDGSASVTGGEIVSEHSYGVCIENGALTVTGGSFSGASGGVSLGAGGTARLSGGTFSTTDSSGYNIYIGNDNTKTLGDLLADGCAYYVGGENGSLITGKLGEKKLTEQSVTVRTCEHAWGAWETSADTPGKFQRPCQGCNTVDTMDAVAAVTAGETVTLYTDIDTAWAAAKAAGTATVTLFADIGLTSTLTVADKENITLTSAEGKNYTVTGMADADSFQVYGSLALENVTISEKTGSGNIIEMQSGSLTLTGAAVSGTSAVPISMGGGCLVMDSGTVSSESTVSHTIQVTGGTLQIIDGTVTGVRSAIYVDGGSLIIDGGALTSESNAAVYMYDGELTMRGGSLISKTYEGLGVKSGTVSVSGGNFTGGTYGMSLSDNATAVLTGGTFTGGVGEASISSNTTLRQLLGKGYAYFTADETSRLITEGLDGSNLSVSPVTVKKCENHIWGDPREDSEGVFLHTCLGCGHEEETTETDWVAMVTADGVKRGYPTIEFAWAAAKKASNASGVAVTVTLLTDIGLKSTLTVEGNENITLTSAEDANYTVTGSGNADSFLVNGSLTLENVTISETAWQDNIIEMQSGSLTLKGAAVNGTSATPISVSGGCLVMDSGTVSTEVGIAIFMDGDSTLTMNDGKVSSESAYSNTIQMTGGNLHIIGGTVTGNLNAIYVSDGSLIIDGGTLNSERHHAVYMEDSKFTMTGGSLNSNYFYGLQVRAGTVSVSGGTITGGDGGMHVQSGTVLVDGGNLTGSSSYGMLLEDPVTAVLTSGTFTGELASIRCSSNTALRTLLGEGYAYFTADETSSLITEGLDDYNLSVSPVTVRECKEHVWGEPTDDGNGGLIHTCLGCGYVEAATDPVAEVTAGGSTKGYPTIELAWAAAKEAKTATVTLLTEVWSATAADPAPGDGTDPGSGQEPDPGTDPGAAAVPLTVAAGETITLVSKANPEGGYYSLHGAGITVEADGSLSLENVTVTNDVDSAVSTVVVSGGSLTAGSGSSVEYLIEDGISGQQAVQAIEGGTFCLNGGTISGGVLLDSAEAVMKSGLVNSSSPEGVMLSGDAKMTVNGGTVTGTAGCAVTLKGSSRLTVANAGQIQGNSIGIRATEGSSMELQGGTVARVGGTAAILLDTASEENKSPSLTMSGGTVDGTYAAAAVEVRSGTATVTGGSLSGGNVALFVLKGGTARIEDGTFGTDAAYALLIAGGSAEVEGGVFHGAEDAVFVKDSGSAEISGGEFTAEKRAALYVKGGSVEVSGGTFTAEQKSTLRAEGGTVSVSGGTFTAKGGNASALYNMGSNVSVSGGTFTARGSNVEFTAAYIGNGSTQISGGTFANAGPIALWVAKSENVKLSGGVFSGTYAIFCEEDGKTVGDILDEGYAYYDGTKVTAAQKLPDNFLNESILPRPVVSVGADSSLPEEQICVELTWGAMEFTYTDGGWNTETHTYEGGWTCAEGADRITAVNTGTAPMKVGCSYTRTDPTVQGEFVPVEASGAASQSAGTQDTDGQSAGSSGEEARLKTKLTRLGVGESLTQQLVLTGKPSDKGEGFALGTVTVTIQPVQRAWLELPYDWFECGMPKIYAYVEGGPEYEKWPGVPMTASGQLGIYYWEIPEGYENCRVIFFCDDAHRYPADQAPGLLMNGMSMIYNGSTWKQYGE